LPNAPVVQLPEVHGENQPDAGKSILAKPVASESQAGVEAAKP